MGLARALAIGPEVMLYDEPTTGLDPIMSDVINELILQTQRSKKTTGVVVTHDMKTVTKVADRVVMLYPLARLGPRRVADPLRRPARGPGVVPRPAGRPVRPRRGRRTAPRDGPAQRTHPVPETRVRQPGSGRRTAIARMIMNERLMQFRIGMFVIVAGLVLTMMIVWFGESPSLLRDQVYLKVRYAEAPGVLEGVPVRKSGIRIGEVVAIAFDERPNQPDGVLVTLALERRYQVREGSSPRLTRSLIGDVAIDMQPGTGDGFIAGRQDPSRGPDHRGGRRAGPVQGPGRRHQGLREGRRHAHSRSTRRPPGSPRSPRAPTTSTSS